MPKIRDLGINVIPDMTRPPEIGYGGGCGATPQCGPNTQRTDATCTATDTGYYAGCPGLTFASADCCPAASNMYGNYGEYTCGATRVTCSEGWRWGMYTCGATRGTCSPQCTPTVKCSEQQCTPTYGCTPTVIPCTPTVNDPSPFCHPKGTGGLTRESIAQLKAQLQQQIEALDEYAKSIGPKTAEEISAREKELQAELEELARRRKDLGK
jgi:hypothetical protein